MTSITRLVEELAVEDPAPEILDLIGHLWGLLPRDEAIRLSGEVLSRHLENPDQDVRSLHRCARFLSLLATNPDVEQGFLSLDAALSRQQVSMVKELLQMSFAGRPIIDQSLDILRKSEAPGR